MIKIKLMYQTKTKKQREIKLKLESENFKSTYGTTTPENPSVIYINIFSWCKHLDLIENYQENIRNLKSKIKYNLKSKIINNDCFNIEMLCNVNSKKTNLIDNDRYFHFSVEVILKLEKECENGISDVSNETKELVEHICVFMEKDKNFCFKKEKPKI